MFLEFLPPVALFFSSGFCWQQIELPKKKKRARDMLTKHRTGTMTGKDLKKAVYTP
jgi:hypothetical protein